MADAQAAQRAETVYKNYIGGKWVDSSSGEMVQNVNPATGEVLGAAPASTAREVDEAVKSAREAFESWRKVPAPRRGEIVFRAAELLLQRKEQFARMMTKEMGKVLTEARGDVQEGIDMSYYMAGEGRRLFGYTTPAEMPDKMAMAMRDPVGVVAAITPWNFPLAIPTWKIMPALVAGNTVVFKPATDTPAMAAMLVELMEEAGLPAGVLNLVYGSGGVVGEALTNHPDIDLISFTGSTAAGRRVGAVAGEQLKGCHLELGGKNAIIVMDDADLDLAAESIVWSAYGTTGQRCTAASRVIVHRSVKDELAEKLVARIEGLTLGDGLHPETDVGPLINRAAVEKVHSYTEIGKGEGATLVAGGRPADEGELGKGNFYYPTLFTDVKPGMRIAREEIFGPTTCLIAVDSFEEAIEVNNGTEYGLSSSIFTKDVNRAHAAMRDMKSGIVYINHGTTGAEVHLPFGGIKGTGTGHREAGQAAVDFYTEWKSVYVDFSGRLQRAQIDDVDV